MADIVACQGGFSEGTETRNCSFIRAFLCDPWSFPTLVSLNGSQSPHQSVISDTGFLPLLWYLVVRIVFILGKVEAFLITFPSFFVVPSDLTAEERQELENIRRRKQELLADIQVGAGQHLDQGSSHDAF